MTDLQRWMLCLAMPCLAAAAPPAKPDPGVPVVLQSRPGTPLDAAARNLMAQDLHDSARSGERPLVLTGTAKLGAASDRPALFVQLQSPRECGSAGCSTVVYAWSGGRYQRVLDGATGRMTVAATRHRGMADLIADKEEYIWNGSGYISSDPAPNIDLRPRRRPHPHRNRPSS